MKFKALSSREGFSQLFVLVGMLLIVVALPIAVKLVQKNQENRSNAASGISQTKKCTNIKGVCQKKTSACAGTYVSNLCSKSDKGVSCCADVRDTDTCLDVGGRCVEKEATGSGTIKSGLCSKANGSDIVCFVADGSDSPCTAMEGSCVASAAKTSGGSCSLANQKTGFLDLKYSCKATNATTAMACCFPTEYDLNGECYVYSGDPLVAVPGLDDPLCKSGTAVWEGGDKIGTDGTLNWKCKGFNDATTVDCSAKFKTVTDTKKCLDVGGRCKDKTKIATSGGTLRNDKPDLCSESNPSSVGCWVASGSSNPCTAMEGKCIGNAGVTSSGGSCALTSQTTGVYNLTYACKEKTSACCLPLTGDFNAKCKDYGTQILTTIPTNLCVSGSESWTDGDKIGTDGTLNWTCIGSGKGATVSCSAKYKVNGECNSEYVGSTKSFISRPADNVVCSAGKLSNKDTKSGYFTWKCNGLNDGKDVSCKVRFNTCGASGGTCVDNKAKCTSLSGKQGKDDSGFCGKTYCCIVPGTKPADPVLASSVTLDPTSLTLPVGSTELVKATVAPSNATNTTIAWSSNNIAVATVDDSGLVKGITEGTAIITATTTNSKIAKITVTVSASSTVVYATGVTLSPTSFSLSVGSTKTISATVVPSNTTNQAITWSSGATSVATVNSNGVVTAVAVGSAEIKAATTNGKTNSSTVTVVSVGTTTISIGTTTADTADKKISFKFALKGIKPAVSDNFDQLGDLKIEVKNMSSNVYESDISSSYEPVSGEVNNNGDQVFEVVDLSLNSTTFSGVDAFNYVKIKGPFHVRARMCQNAQTSKLSDTTTCAINLTGGTVYDFSDYPLLPGDINLDGIVNGVDYTKLKSYFNEEVDPGTNGDLNLDGVVNGVDAVLLKDSLSSRDDE